MKLHVFSILILDPILQFVIIKNAMCLYVRLDSGFMLFQVFNKSRLSLQSQRGTAFLTTDIFVSVCTICPECHWLRKKKKTDSAKKRACSSRKLAPNMVMTNAYWRTKRKRTPKGRKKFSSIKEWLILQRGERGRYRNRRPTWWCLMHIREQIKESHHTMVSSLSSDHKLCGEVNSYKI